MLLKDKVAIVTGASRGIGRAIAERFAIEGAKLVLSSRTPEAGSSVMDWMRSHGYPAVFQPADVRDRPQVEDVLKVCLETYGEVNVLISSAGIYYAGYCLQTPEQVLREVLDVNVVGSFNFAKAVAAQMVEQGKGGRIILISSGSGVRGFPMEGAYCSSKFAVVGLMQVMAAELAPHRILVTAISPGFIRTDMSRQAMEQLAAACGVTCAEAEAEAVSSIPLGRMGGADDVAGAALYLASDLANYVTGANILVNGGNQVG